MVSSKDMNQSTKTFEEMCPKWSQICEMKYRDRKLAQHDLDLSMRDWNRCIVGEAWGFNGDYYILSRANKGGCSECADFACNLEIGSHYSRCHDKIPRFVEHFNAKHVEMI
jgi:hypothetical protein